MISLTLYLYLELLGAAVLALWVIARFPKLGPKSLIATIGLVIAALALGNLTPAGVAWVATLPFGTYAALLGLVLPFFFSMFLATGWVVRSLLGMAGGSGGGGGHPART